MNAKIENLEFDALIVEFKKALVLGDVLAVCLLKARGFTPHAL